jgi:hypothetical protein
MCIAEMTKKKTGYFDVMSTHADSFQQRMCWPQSVQVEVYTGYLDVNILR